MHVHVEKKHAVLRLTLNRPEKRNALTAEMCTTLVNAVLEAQEDQGTRSILLAGNGQVFCAGMDLEESLKADVDPLARLHDKLFTMGSWSNKPIVVCVNGAALAAGLGLALQGHIVTASSGAAFGLTEIRVGLWPLIIYRTVEEALGPRRTLELSLTGRLFCAEDALAWGLISSICHAEEVRDRAKGLANDLARASGAAISIGMNYVGKARGKTLDEKSALAIKMRHALFTNEDLTEGVSAFHHKREPVWPSLRK